MSTTTLERDRSSYFERLLVEAEAYPGISLARLCSREPPAAGEGGRLILDPFETSFPDASRTLLIPGRFAYRWDSRTPAMPKISVPSGPRGFVLVVHGGEALMAAPSLDFANEFRRALTRLAVRDGIEARSIAITDVAVGSGIFRFDFKNIAENVAATWIAAAVPALFVALIQLSFAGTGKLDESCKRLLVDGAFVGVSCKLDDGRSVFIDRATLQAGQDLPRRGDPEHALSGSSSGPVDLTARIRLRGEFLAIQYQGREFLAQDARLFAPFDFEDGLVYEIKAEVAATSTGTRILRVTDAILFKPTP